MNKYKITFCEADTGVVLQENGQRWNSDLGKPTRLPEFEKIEDAYLYKDNLLKKFPFGEVSIANGKDVKVYRNDKQLEVYLQERSKVYRWMSLPFFIKWFKKKPNCKKYKER